MRILPERNDDHGGTAALEEPESLCGPNQGCVYQYAALTASMPLRNLCRDYRCGAARRAGNERRSAMIHKASIGKATIGKTDEPEAPELGGTISRRGFVKTGGALFVSLALPLRFATRAEAA